MIGTGGLTPYLKFFLELDLGNIYYFLGVCYLSTDLTSFSSFYPANEFDLDLLISAAFWKAF
jgi:hypothetical protein